LFRLRNEFEEIDLSLFEVKVWKVGCLD